ncbi:MAG: hypothetical protein JXQ74_02635 [Alphaproteobacteria bacterium]|nr:hypothetical protein [Alphaproteobacteria bacterium]
MEKIINGGLLKGKKTYITTTLGLLSALGAYLIGEMDLAGFLQTVFPLVGILFLRKGIADQSQK